MNDFVNTPRLSELSTIVPVFPLSGTVILPGSELPLHIFEERYRDMIQDSLNSLRIIGIVQPIDKNGNHSIPKLYQVGCIGRIVGFRETHDGRYYITLNGVCRFRIVKELNVKTQYRQTEVSYLPFAGDLDTNEESMKLLDRKALFPSLKKFFYMHDIKIDWDALKNVSDSVIVRSLAMTCPFASNEKQVLLEAQSVQDRAKIISSLIDMAIIGKINNDKNPTMQ